MEEYSISKEYAVTFRSDSKGSQPKYHKDGYWYKVDTMGKEGLVEKICSIILSCSNVTNYVEYEECIINGRQGCRSKDFLKQGEAFVTFQKIFQYSNGGSLADRIMGLETPERRYEYLLELIRENCKLDCTHYLQNNFALDMLIMNPDRYFHNLGVILREDGSYDEAPIFDNGQGLFQNRNIFPPYLTITEKEERACGATISGSFEKQFIVAGKHFLLDYEKLFDLLACYESLEIYNVLKNQLQKYRKLLEI